MNLHESRQKKTISRLEEFPGQSTFRLNVCQWQVVSQLWLCHRRRIYSVTHSLRVERKPRRVRIVSQDGVVEPPFYYVLPVPVPPSAPCTPAIIMLSVWRFCQGEFLAHLLFIYAFYIHGIVKSLDRGKASGSQFITQCYKVITCRLIHDYRFCTVSITVVFVAGTGR